MKKMLLVFVLPLILCICGCSNNEKIEVDFNSLIENNKDVSLSVYYSEIAGFDYSTRTPLKGEFFTSGYESGNPDIVREYFDSAQLKEFSEHFKNFGKKEYICSDDKDIYVNTRLVYVFESEKNGKLLEVILGCGDIVSVNGKYVSVYEDIDALELYEVILPFITNEGTKNDVVEHISLCKKMYGLID